MAFISHFHTKQAQMIQMIQMGRYVCVHVGMCVFEEDAWPVDCLSARQADRQTGRQTGRQADRQIGR